MSNLLPSSATSQEHALDDATARVGDVPVPVKTLWAPDDCPANILPWLAWAFSVDDWDASWSDEQKRATIKTSVAVHKHKGTIGAVRDSVRALGVEAQVQEWFNQLPEGAPYTFRLLLDTQQTSLTQDQLIKLLDVIDTSKNLRSHLDTVVPGSTSLCQVYGACVAGVGSEIVLNYETATAPGSPLTLDGSWTLNGAQELDGIRN